jgi:hypothetical protein
MDSSSTSKGLHYALRLNRDQQEALAQTAGSPSAGTILRDPDRRLRRHRSQPGGIYWRKRLDRVGESEG